MTILVWLLMGLLSAIPAVTCLVYYDRRLGARRDLLRETLSSMGLDDFYMKMRHPEVEDPSEDDFRKAFDSDFRAGLSAPDYVWPVSLFSVVSLLGWFVTFSLIYGSKTGLNALVPPAFAYGFMGAFLATLFEILDNFRTLSLDPYEYYSATSRILFSSLAAYVAALAAPAVFVQSAIPMLSFGIGLIPVDDVRDFIVNKTSQLAGTAGASGERGLSLKVIQGLEDRETRKRLVDMNISTVQALATCDPFRLFLQTTLPLRSIIDMIDKAILYLYIGDTVGELRKQGINGVIELVTLAHLGNREAAYEMSGDAGSAIDPFFADVDAVSLVARVATVLNQEPNVLKAFIYNCYYDPQISLIYDIWGKYLNPKKVSPPPAKPIVAEAVPPVPGGATTAAPGVVTVLAAAAGVGAAGSVPPDPDTSAVNTLAASAAAAGGGAGPAAAVEIPPIAAVTTPPDAGAPDSPDAKKSG